MAQAPDVFDFALWKLPSLLNVYEGGECLDARRGGRGLVRLP